MTMQQMFAKIGVSTDRYASLAGPAFARSMFQDEPILMSLASHSPLEDLDSAWKNSFSVQKTSDVVGQEVCGAMKNVVAIAAGVSSTLGPSAQAATVGVLWNDVGDLIACMGGNKSTTTNASMMGDLLATSSPDSRSFRFGVSCTDITRSVSRESHTIEGFHSLQALLNSTELAEKVPGYVQRRFGALGSFVRNAIDGRTMVNIILE